MDKIPDQQLNYNTNEENQNSMKTEKDKLREDIEELRSKQAIQLVILKEQFQVTYESLKPINIIKNTLHEVTSSPEIKNNLAGSSIGMVTGYLTKKLLFGKSHNPLKMLIGTFLQYAVTNLVSNHPEGIKSVGENLLKRFRKSKEEINHQQYKNGSE